ncbi:MAG: twin-arginine translocase TatA/TatE family subunit [Firmicutes bacterium]|nr:twin-arginine translocase TatA/TatE family subunit [Bacillota bacterium]
MWANLVDPAHLVLLLVVVLLLFGPKRLPELGSSLGKTIRMFRDAQREEGPSHPNSAEGSLETTANPEQPLPPPR